MKQIFGKKDKKSKEVKVETQNLWLICFFCLSIFPLLGIFGCAFSDETILIPIDQTEDVSALSRQSASTSKTFHFLQKLMYLSKKFETPATILGEVNIFATAIVLFEDPAEEWMSHDGGVTKILSEQVDRENSTKEVLTETTYPDNHSRISFIETFLIKIDLDTLEEEQLLDYLGFVLFRDHSTATIQVQDLDAEDKNLLTGSVQATFARAFPNDKDRVSLWEKVQLLLREPLEENLILKLEQRVTMKDGVVHTLSIEPEFPVVRGETIAPGEVTEQIYFPPGSGKVRAIFQKTRFDEEENGKIFRTITFDNGSQDHLEIVFSREGDRNLSEIRSDGTVTEGEFTAEEFWLLTRFPKGHDPVSLRQQGFLKNIKNLKDAGGAFEETVTLGNGEKFSKKVIFEFEEGKGLHIAIREFLSGDLGWFTVKRDSGEIVVAGCLLKVENPGSIDVRIEGFYRDGKVFHCFPPMDKGFPGSGIVSQTSIDQILLPDERSMLRVNEISFTAESKNSQSLVLRFESDGTGEGEFMRGDDDFSLKIHPDRSGQLIDQTGAVAFFVY